MAAAAPVRHLLNISNDGRQGNRCPICQEWEAPSWKGGEVQFAVQYRQECCGVLICRECYDDWRGEREKVIHEFEEKCGRKAYAKFEKRWSKKLRARARGEKDKEDEAKSKTKKKGGKEDEKKRALEKSLERHWSCPSCRAPMGTTPEDDVRMYCCGVLICRECFDDWKGERIKVIHEFEEKCGRKAYAQFKKLWSEKLRARARGEKDKEEEAKSKKKKRGGEEDEKKRALEKLLERHWSCPSCRAPIWTCDEDAVLQVRRNADRGQSWAQCLLGSCYREGRGVRKDARQAERWFRAAMTDMSVMDGGPEAAYRLGYMYAEGEGVRKDLEEAKKLFTMAHEAGYVRATTDLGFLFGGGFGPAAGVPDREKQLMLYRQAAEAGYDKAQYNLGNCYDNGKGVEQDKEKAKAWYAKAAKPGNAGAMNNLARVLLHTEGAAAMPAAMALLRVAAQKGDAEAQKLMSILLETDNILSFCASCGKPAADMAGAPLKCARCKAAAYCSAACQKQHWKRGGHKTACNEREKFLPEKEKE